MINIKYIEKLRDKYKNKKQKSYLSIVSINKINSSNISFYVASKNTYYTDILSIFNLSNAVVDENPTYQNQSLEYIQRVKPEYIFNFSNENIDNELKKSLSYNFKIININEKYSSVPGPISIIKLINNLDSLLAK